MYIWGWEIKFNSPGQCKKHRLRKETISPPRHHPHPVSPLIPPPYPPLFPLIPPLVRLHHHRLNLKSTTISSNESIKASGAGI